MTDAAAETSLPRVFLQPGRDRRWRGGHPWAYSNEIKMNGETKSIPPGALVTLHRVDGKPLGIASFNPHALIAARRLIDDTSEVIDQSFFSKRLHHALKLRERLYDNSYYRLIHADADGLPGTIIDRYDEAVVIQLNTAGAEHLRGPLLTALDEVLSPQTVVLKGDDRARQQEGLQPLFEVSKGNLSKPVPVIEGNGTFFTDLSEGQKTGWFFDQRDNRAYLARLAGGARMLDLYCYAGGFGLQALLAGANSLIGIDSSQSALELANQAAVKNGVEKNCDWRRGDSFRMLEEFAGAGHRFDVVVADPPAFVKSRKALGSGRKGYRKLARLAAGVVAPRGFLMLCSCSYHVDAATLGEECARGIAAAERTALCIRAAGAGADHPVHPNLPETNYLKSVLYAMD